LLQAVILIIKNILLKYIFIELNELSEGVSGSLEEQGEAQSEGDASGSREVEDGVSSSGAETAGRMGRTRTPITWAGSPAGPASTSPQRSLNRAGIAGATQVN